MAWFLLPLFLFSIHLILYGKDVCANSKMAKENKRLALRNNFHVTHNFIFTLLWKLKQIQKMKINQKSYFIFLNL